MQILVDRYHYPVGQGIFSAQVIKGLGDSKYVCVYDCGSVSGADNIPICVKDLYEKLNPGKEDKVKIDLLVISHLDKDHVNGVLKLIEFFDIKKIVIPYMSKIEKIILALGALNGGRAAYGQEYLTPRFSLVNAIIGAEGNVTRFLERSQDTEIVESSREVSTEHFDMNEDTSSVERWPYKVWEFLHFSLYAGEEELIKDMFIERFKKSCKSALGREIEDLNEITAGDLNNHWDNLRNAYKDTCKYVKDLFGVKCNDIFNSSSIILYSGPADNLLDSGENYWRVQRESEGQQVIVDHKIPDDYYLENFCFRFKNANSKYIGGWLGTGDARLEDSQNINELRFNLGQERVNRIRVLTVPHHGSKNNSNYEFYSIFSRTRVECVVHSDPGYTFHHPHFEIKKLIADKGFVEVPVTKESESYYREHLKYRYW